MLEHTIGLSRIATKRRQFIEKAIGCSGSILEVGAFDNPIYRRELGDQVMYVDWFSREELIENHKENTKRRPECIVEIDFVVKHNRIAEAVGRRFELICASHVIEHIPDVLFWLNELYSMLEEGGRIFLAVPDKRYTFDYYRSVSTAGEMIRAHQERLDRPSKWQLLDHIYYHQNVDLAGIWAGVTPGHFQPRCTMAHALTIAEKKSQIYTDCHCWTFTSDSFVQLVRDLTSAGLFNFSIEEMDHPQRGTNEFYVLLRKLPG